MDMLRRHLVTLQNRESMIKNSMQGQLVISVKEVQADMEAVEENSDATASSLSIVLEAIFIHGLKETLLNKMSQAIGTDPDQRPEPNFWAPLLIFSHRDVIEQVSMLSQVTTDVGRSRAWLRIALNDGLLSSYLQSIISDNSALHDYYNRYAFLRDIERLDVAKDLIRGIEACCFKFSCNSSLLNIWTNRPLQMAGVWSPPMKSWPIQSGTDVARTIADEEETLSKQTDSSNVSITSFSLQDSLLNSQLMFDEEEALKIILGTPVNESPLQVRLDNDQSSIEGEDVAASETKLDSPDDEKKTEQRDETIIVNCDTEPTEREKSDKVSDMKELPRDDATVPWAASLSQPVQSYDSLLKSYNKDTGSSLKAPDLKDVIQQYHSLPEEQPDKKTGQAVSEENEDYNYLAKHLTTIATESGLAAQNYSCAFCKNPLGINMEKVGVCWFTGKYYCKVCFCCSGEEWVIPARILHNWDFQKYPISKRAAEFLSEIQNHPILDLKSINSRLYVVAEEMAQLQALRMKLNLLRGYLYTCNKPVIEQLRKQIWPREYLYEHVHLYSVSDLSEIQTGALSQVLLKAVAFARDHVLSCSLCKQKGFICEICSSQTIIYPFDLERTYKCRVCNAVFHLGCLNSYKPCPKCERQKRRRQES